MVFVYWPKYYLINAPLREVYKVGRLADSEHQILERESIINIIQGGPPHSLFIPRYLPILTELTKFSKTSKLLLKHRNFIAML